MRRLQGWLVVLAAVCVLIFATAGTGIKSGLDRSDIKDFADSAGTVTDGAIDSDAITVDSLAIGSTAFKIESDRVWFPGALCGVDSCPQKGDTALVACTAVGDSSNTAIFLTGYQADFAGATATDMTFWVVKIWPGVSFKVEVENAYDAGHVHPAWFSWVVIRYE